MHLLNSDDTLQNGMSDHVALIKFNIYIYVWYSYFIWFEKFQSFELNGYIEKFSIGLKSYKILYRSLYLK